MENEELQTGTPRGVVVAKGVAVGVICCSWWLSWKFDIALSDSISFSMAPAIVLSAVILFGGGLRGWRISTGLAAAMWWGIVFLYPFYARLFLDFEVSDLYFLYETVYFVLFFSLALILLFLIWLAREMYKKLSREGQINGNQHFE